MNKFTVFLKDGGSNESVSEYWQSITKAFDSLSKNTYTNIELQFHVEIRVSGRYLSYGDIVGCSQLRYMKKRNIIAVCISLNESVWANKTYLKNFLHEQLILAFNQFIIKLEKEKIALDSDRLQRDVIHILE